MSNLLTYDESRPVLGEQVYLAPGCHLIGQVKVGKGSSVWFNSVLRGDINRVEIGNFTNIQDLSLCHVADDHACVIGNYVTVGHRAILHACRIGNEVLVGMGSTVMDGAVVGDQSIIGAHALVTKDTIVPPGSMVYGSPARVVRSLEEKERLALRKWAEKYHKVASRYLEVSPLPFD